MKKVLLILLPVLNTAVAQISNPVDSSLVLENIIVKAYENNRRLIDVAAPVSITGQMQLNRFNNMSILPALNITRKQVDEFLDTLNEAVAEMQNAESVTQNA